jgi:hypothetical protein
VTLEGQEGIAGGNRSGGRQTSTLDYGLSTTLVASRASKTR